MQICKYVGSCLWVSKPSVPSQMSDSPLSYMTVGGGCNAHHATQITLWSFILHNCPILENKSDLMKPFLGQDLSVVFFTHSQLSIVNVSINFVRHSFL